MGINQEKWFMAHTLEFWVLPHQVQLTKKLGRKEGKKMGVVGVIV
jgi:hypothetical protein